MLHSIVGLMNSGKTLYMTYKLFLAWASGKTIITNYDVAFPHFKINKDWLFDLANRKDFVLENVAFGIDELWIWADSRASGQNRIVSYFFLQSSKDDTEIYFTAQSNDQNDRRLRTNLHKLSQCNRVILEDGDYYNIPESERFLPTEILERLYIKITEFKKINFGLYSDLLPHKTEYIKANTIFKLYNTRQKILRGEK